MKIIDFHVHPYRTEEQNLGMYKEAYQLSLNEQQSQLMKSGISKICGSVIIGRKALAIFETIRECNREALQIRRMLGEFYVPGIHVHPFFPKESCDEIEWAHKNGMRMIGELVPYAHGWEDFSDKRLKEILDCAKQYRMIVSYHSTDGDEVERMLGDNPEILFVAAHPGERGRVEQHLERMMRYPNLYLDLSGTGLFRYGMLKYMVNKIGSERILFGTDYPICNPGMYIQAVYCEEISDEARENIFYKNAERVLGRCE